MSMLSELFLFQHLHYFNASHSLSSSFSSSFSSPSSASVLSEKNKNEFSKDNGNDKNNNNYRNNDRKNNDSNNDNTYKNSENYENKNRSNYDSTKKKHNNIKKNVTFCQIYTEMDWELGSSLICIPLGIMTLPCSTSLSSLNEQNVTSLLLDGEFGTKVLENSRIKDPILILESEKKDRVKSVKTDFFDDPPLRFLVFPVIHISLSSILPIILSYANTSYNNINDNNNNDNETIDEKSKDKINEVNNTSAKNTQYYDKNILSKESINNELNKNSTRLSGIREVQVPVPPLSASFSRDLCFDLLSAVNHCIDWYVIKYGYVLC